MILRLGPITIMSTSTRRAYAKLALAAYKLHETIWYTNDLGNTIAQREIKLLNNQLAEAISRTPPEDIV